jgi:hypothetical protein
VNALSWHFCPAIRISQQSTRKSARRCTSASFDDTPAATCGFPLAPMYLKEKVL